MTVGAFDRAVIDCPDPHMQTGIIRVLDTADVVRAWLADNEVPYTAADLLGFTKAILAEEKHARARDFFGPPGVG